MILILLSLIQKKGPIVPDGQLKDVKKCIGVRCLTVFKNRADAERHERIIHNDPRVKKSINEQFAFECGFTDEEGNKCVKVFSTRYYLRKHRLKEKHAAPSRKKAVTPGS